MEVEDGCGRGRGRGHGRGYRGYNPYQMSRSYGEDSNFKPEAKSYQRDEWESLSSNQKSKVTELKAQQGWINGYTPPPGFTLDDKGYAVPSNALVSAVQRHIGAASMQPESSSVASLPPLPPSTQPVPPVIETNPRQAGASFGHQGSRVLNDDT